MTETFRFLGKTGRATSFLIAGLALSIPLLAQDSRAEYEIKAGFLYNFLLFSQWPDEALGEQVTIGIVGQDPFENYFAPVEGLAIEDRILRVRRFEPTEGFEGLRECQILYVHSSASSDLNEILEAIAGLPILTVGETKDFIDRGGMARFLIEKGRIRFELSPPAADAVGIRFRSKLLRLASKLASPATEGSP